MCEGFLDWESPTHFVEDSDDALTFLIAGAFDQHAPESNPPLNRKSLSYLYLEGSNLMLKCNGKFEGFPFFCLFSW